MSGWSQRLKSFDVYRDIPKDLTEQTTSGAVVSLAAAVFIGYLFLAELFAFLSPSVTHAMFVDHPFLPHLYTSSALSAASTMDSYDLLTIHLNITLLALPCASASLDVQDVMGAHVEDVGGSVQKLPTADSRGCNFAGRLVVRKVPGNLHLSAHGHPEALHGSDVNVSHAIHSLYFGDDDALLRVPGAVTQPLAGRTRIAAPVNAVNPYGQQVVSLPSYEYYLKLVPTQAVGLRGEVSAGYQYIAHSNAVGGRYRMAAVYFRYDVDAVTVRFERKGRSLAHFVVQLCAIVGGVFTVLGLVNGALLTASKTLKKQQIGKLG